MSIKECYIASKSPQDFMARWIATAEDRVCRGFNGESLELTMRDDPFCTFTTGALNRRKKAYEATAYLCKHYYRHTKEMFSDWHFDGVVEIGSRCDVCNVVHWSKYK